MQFASNQILKISKHANLVRNYLHPCALRFFSEYHLIVFYMLIIHVVIIILNDSSTLTLQSN